MINKKQKQPLIYAAVRLPENDIKKLQAVAEKKEVSVSWVIRSIIKQHFTRGKK